MSGIIFVSAIALIATAFFRLRLNAVLSFWMTYILTRPLGASIGDCLSQPIGNGGLGLGTVVTSGVFLAAILATVAYLAISNVDVCREALTAPFEEEEAEEFAGDLVTGL